MPRPLLERRQSSAFADWLNQILITKNIAPTTLAAHAGMSGALVSMLRNGRRRPSYKAVVRLTRALGMEADLPRVLELAQLPSVVLAAPSGGRRNRKALAPIDLTPLLPIVTERRADSEPPNVERWELLVGMEKMIADPSWRVRRQAGLMLSGMARMIGGEAIEYARVTLANAARREKHPDARHTLEQAASMLNQVAIESGRAEHGERARLRNALRDLVKQSARG